MPYALVLAVDALHALEQLDHLVRHRQRLLVLRRGCALTFSCRLQLARQERHQPTAGIHQPAASPVAHRTPAQAPHRASVS
jgi:hypothetical protein